MAIPIESVCWRLDTCSEASASCHASAACYRFAKDVLFIPVIESERKLVQIQRQIFDADVVKCADNAALQETPKRLDIVGIDLTAHVFQRLVIDHFVTHLLAV